MELNPLAVLDLGRVLALRPSTLVPVLQQVSSPAQQCEQFVTTSVVGQSRLPGASCCTMVRDSLESVLAVDESRPGFLMPHCAA